MGFKTIGFITVETLFVSNRLERLLLKILKSLGLDSSTMGSISS